MNAGGMLVAAPERWDEACFAVPALRALVASGLETGILCAESQLEFWQTLAGLTVIPYPLKAKAKSVAQKISGSWQASLAWENGLAAEAFKIAAIPQRLGVNERMLKKRITHPLTCAVGPLEHRVRYYLASAEELGIRTARSEFFTPAELGITPISGAILLCPGSDFGPSHEWPLDRWEEISQTLVRGGHRLSIASVDRDGGLGKALAAKLGDSVAFFQASPLGGALPLLAVQSLVIAADGSLPHLAAHAGATCVTLFGPNDPVWKRPLGTRHVIVKRHAECAPCLLPKCPMDLRCQRELETERVMQAVWEKLGVC